MKNMRCVQKKGTLVAIFAIALLLTGCARSAPVHYYQLSALDAEKNRPAIAPGATVIGIGPVRLPEYLDRPQIITRLTPNRLQLADTHRWAEPLSENIPRVLGENLSVLLGTDRIILHPWPSSSTTDYQLLVEVLRFENESDGAARLTVRWWVKGKDGGIVLPEKRSSYLVSAAAQDQDGLVGALNAALGSFCREIAQALSPLLAKGPQSGR